MKHTPGPLHLLPSRTLVNIKGQRGEQICQLPIDHPNAARLVHCWNACEDMDDPAADIAKLRQDNADLLLAAGKVLKHPMPLGQSSISENGEHLGMFKIFGNRLDALRAAISKATP